tara:strand:- start:795 stop:941 length:147 start_codon:yes stop_codon:yes gene_type:complete
MSNHEKITYCTGVNVIGQPTYVTHNVSRYKDRSGKAKVSATSTKEFTE